MQLKVLSWNIWCDCDFAKVTEFLRISNADIIGLQEIVPGDTGRNIVGFLSKLGYEYAVAPIGATLDDGRMITSGVFSKYPILARTPHTLSEKSKRQAIATRIKVGNIALNASSFHLKHTHHDESTLRNLQVENLIKVLPQENVVVTGDFNATPSMTTIKRMREVLIDTDPQSTPTLDPIRFDCAGCDKTLVPQARLDYIFVSRDLKFHSFKVEDGEGSDHLPISVIVEV